MSNRLPLRIAATLGVALAALACSPCARAQAVRDEVVPAAHAADHGRMDEVEVIRQLARRRGGQPAALAQIIQMSREFDAAVSAELVDELADAHLRAGALNLAAETRRALAEQYPDQPRAQEAVLWLVRLYASSEMIHARREPSPGTKALLRQLPAGARSAPADASASLNEGEPSVPTAAAAGSASAPYALHLAAQAIARHPTLAKSDALAFERAVAARLAGQLPSAQALLSPLKHRRPGDPWGDAARVEAWLEQDAGETSPKPTVVCVAVDEPPQLDGALTEPCWQASSSVSIRSNAAATTVADQAAAAALPRAQVQLAYDSEFLYVAVVCDKATGVDYPDDPRPRSHDGDVERYDRIRLRLDVDRDYASYYELVVDSRGWTADRCWGDAAWNPEWFVAVGDHHAAVDATWTIEAAIPWSELTVAPPAAGAVWACSIERAVPKAEPQSWIGPPSERPGPESFGLLLFD